MKSRNIGAQRLVGVPRTHLVAAHRSTMNVEVGLRVVRGPDWKWGSQDGGEGFVGTVVEIGRAGASSPDETVIVRWDSGTKTNYRIGYQDAYDLRVVDNATVGVKHVNIVCDGCKKRGILGIRWRCTMCDDYDLCTPCYMSDKHDVKHSFVRYDTVNCRGVDVGKRKDCQKVMLQGIFVGAKVQRGPDWDWGNQDGGKGKIGRVVDIRGWDGESGRSVANVIWASGITNVYRVGHKGKVDLTVATPGKNGYYYPDHLAILGKKDPEEDEAVASASARQAATVAAASSETTSVASGTSASTQGATNASVTAPVPGVASRFAVGEKVTVVSDLGRLKMLADGHGGWNPKMGESVGKIGIVHRITDRGDVRVLFGGRDKWTFHPMALTKAPHEFSVGDVVRVIDDRPSAVELQRGHGEWADSMCNALGKVGRVLKVYADRDLRVCVDGATWTLNPLCVSLVPGSAMELFNTMGSNHHRRDDSDHQNPLPSVSSYLDGAMNRDAVATITPVPCPTESTAVSGAAAISGIQARLSRAAAEGDLRELADLLRQYPEAANSRINGKTILQVACHQGHLDVVRFLLSSPPPSAAVPPNLSPLSVRVDIEAADDEGDTPLHYAAFGNQPEVMELLVQKGANINAVNKARCTPLHVVVNKQFAACTRVLLRHGADVNMQDSYGDTALHDAIGKDSGEILVMLASVPGCDFSIKNNRGFNALHHAALKGNNLAVEKILERSRQLVDVRKDDGFSALHLAALNGHLLVARTLFCLGHCQLDARNNRGQTALMLASSQAHVSVVDLLVRADGNGAGPSLAATDDDDGDTATHVALIKSQGSLTPLASPLSPGPPVNVASVHEIWQELSRGSGGPEMAAMAIGCFLVSRGAPLNARNRKGKTPLELVASEEWKAKLLAYAQYYIAGQGQSSSISDGVARPSGVDGATSVASDVPPATVPVAASGSSTASGAASSSGGHRPGVSAVVERPECVVCCEPGAMASLVRFLPCGHVIACRDCAVRMKKCLRCGLVISEKISLDEPLAASKVELVEELAMLQQMKIRGPSGGYVDVDGAFVSAVRVRELEEKIAEMEEVQTCSICLERRKNVVFLCGHGACVACSATLSVCHMCRAVITRKINVY